jgi:hypothetical protein
VTPNAAPRGPDEISIDFCAEAKFLIYRVYRGTVVPHVMIRSQEANNRLRYGRYAGWQGKKQAKAFSVGLKFRTRDKQDANARGSGARPFGQRDPVRLAWSKLNPGNKQLDLVSVPQRVPGL